MPNKKCCHHIVQFSKRYEFPIDEKKETYYIVHILVMTVLHFV